MRQGEDRAEETAGGHRFPSFGETGSSKAQRGPIGNKAPTDAEGDPQMAAQWMTVLLLDTLF